VIQRRHIIFAGGYDPQDVDGFHGMFRSAVKRFLRFWPVKAEVSPPTIESDSFARWTVETAGPSWKTATRYDFLRQEQIIRANIAESMVTQLPRALWWIVDDLASGTITQVFRSCWRFAAHHIYFQLLLLIWIGIAIGGGWLAGSLLARFAGLSGWLAFLIGAVIAIGLFAALRPLFDRWHVVQITNHWPLLRRFGRGDRPINAGAERLVAAARANEADEIVVVGHSGGCVLALAIVARALQRDPDLGRHGPKIAVITLGSIMPAVALHPSATVMREIVRRIAIEPSIVWADCQSRKDIMNFWDFDPIAGVGIEAGSERCNPAVWQVRFKDMVSPEFYRRLRTNFFRLHYQFILGADRRATYDYVMLTCGPLPTVEWARDPIGTLARFGDDAALPDARADTATPVRSA
jgi:pimeloyl-ACP methyl ester carboxylesterase